MNKTKKDKLMKAGWKIGTVSEFLDLSPEEAAFVEIKLALASYVKQQRMRKKLTQVIEATTTQKLRSLASGRTRICTF